ncbi:MAG: hypothetical protein KJ904_01550 [Alphaproteobacteria bacterium]|nr:hypothetical protein [Alphaproteobacteria bacterium]MBU0796813.1 hypothetical protein [Alphaproteobacteria bacterium]MBU0885829.1 hypothetical protein [Alphaproteobacteria bacterium]MBU1812094.1 hypothetical protein [Alphaproteobacteria bacterium]MBU2090157.1 hypothetical protein [Alphaproteobacteria bacterium]
MPILPCLLILGLTLVDIVSAALYTFSEWEYVGYLRSPHEIFAAILFLLAALSPRLPGSLRLTGLIYILFIGIYTMAGFIEGPGQGLIISSAAKLALPVILFGAGFVCINDPKQLKPLILTLIILGIATTLFGRWDRVNTEFWTDTLRYGEYLMDVKGVMIGYRASEFLPFNFFGFDDTRRAAGLLAAPLAQGSFLATACMVALGWFRQRNLLVAMVLVILFLVGIRDSGTRGAMLMLAIALPLFLMLTARGLSSLVANLATLAFVSILSLGAITTILSYTVGLQDGSTIGHVEALRENLEGIGSVALLGFGIGSAGATAADLGLDIAGGGEGAIFSIAFQIGVPGALAFLAFFAALIAALARALFQSNDLRDATMPAAAIALAIGAASSLPVSEHFLTASGMGAFWIFLGAVTGSSRPASGRQR